MDNEIAERMIAILSLHISICQDLLAIAERQGASIGHLIEANGSAATMLGQLVVARGEDLRRMSAIADTVSALQGSPDFQQFGPNPN